MRKLGFGREVLPSDEAIEAMRSSFSAAAAQPERKKRTDSLIKEVESHRKHNGFAKLVAQAYSAPKD